MKIRGLTEHQEQDPRLLLRDTRTIGEHLHHFFESPRNGAIVLLGSALAVLFVKSIADFIFYFVWVCFGTPINAKPLYPCVCRCVHICMITTI